MAINFKAILANALLTLCKTKPLDEIKVSDLIDYTGISHQTFYNHFRNKNELIYWVIKEYIVVTSNPLRPPTDCYENMIHFYSVMLENKRFIKQASKLTGPGCLEDCLHRFSYNWYIQYIRICLNVQELEPEMLFAIRYNSYAFIGSTMEWIATGMQMPPEQMARYRIECTPRILKPFLPAPSMPYYPHIDSPAFMQPTQFPANDHGQAEVPMKKLFAAALLELCHEIPLEKITVRHLLEKTGAGRQTFYRHFHDKNDLIQWTFHHEILYLSPDGRDFHNCWLIYYKRLETHRHFMAQAGRLVGQNSLIEYMHRCTIEWYRTQYMKYYSTTVLPPELEFAVKYHAYGIEPVIIDWVNDEFQATCEDMADYSCTCQPAFLYKYPFIDDLLR